MRGWSAPELCQDATRRQWHLHRSILRSTWEFRLRCHFRGCFVGARIGRPRWCSLSFVYYVQPICFWSSWVLGLVSKCSCRGVLAIELIPHKLDSQRPCRGTSSFSSGIPARSCGENASGCLCRQLWSQQVHRKSICFQGRQFWWR